MRNELSHIKVCIDWMQTIVRIISAPTDFRIWQNEIFKSASYVPRLNQRLAKKNAKQKKKRKKSCRQLFLMQTLRKKREKGENRLLSFRHAKIGESKKKTMHSWLFKQIFPFVISLWKFLRESTSKARLNFKFENKFTDYADRGFIFSSLFSLA